MLSIRLATEKDYDDVLRMSKSFFEASTYNRLTYTSDGIENLFNEYLKSDKTEIIVLVLVNESDEPIGMLVGAKSVPFFTTEFIASELAWWVDPEYRKTRQSIDLVKAYEVWAKKVGCSVVTMANIPTLNGEKIGKLYEKLGYFKNEVSYMKEI